MKTKTIETFEDACKAEGLNPKKAIPDISGSPEQDQEALLACAKLMIITRALNRDANGGIEWKPDWSNPNEYKYYPWFYMGGSSGFRFYVCDHWSTPSFVGSRLCFKTRELAVRAGKKFIALYKQFMIIK